MSRKIVVRQGDRYLFNTPILTDYGLYEFLPLRLEEARSELMQGHISAVGHPETAKVISEVLGLQIKANRIQVKMLPGDRAIVFRLLSRIPEGTVLTREEILLLPFEFGLLIRIE